jgi:uncharacterized protein (TIGR02145 family)
LVAQSYGLMKQLVTLILSLFLSTLVYSQSIPSYVPTNGLVGWWGFNGNAQDASGNGNHGTIVGSITNTTDRFGIANSALFFNGNDCHIPLPTLNTLPYRPISYSAWVIVNSYFPITFGHKFRAIAGRNTAGVGDCGVIGFWSDGGYPSSQQNTFLMWRGGGSTGSPPLAATSPQLNQWVHVVYTQEINGDWKWYMNGALSNSGNFTDPMNYFSEFRIGGCNNYDCSWNDKLDDIGIWNRALTQQEITDLYNAQSGVAIPTTTSCLNDTATVTIAHPTLNGVANAALRLNYNPDSLTYLGFTNLNPNFSGMTITGGNGTLLMDWNAQSNQNIPAGNTVTLRFRVNGSSPLTWDTTFVPSEFSDINFNIIPQTFVNGSLTENTQRLTWNRTICEGQSFSLGSQSFTTAGNYQGVLPRSSGQCDTLVNLSLHVIPRETTISATVCSNQPYSFNGQSLTSSGVYRDTLVNSLGCDSILVLNLTAHPGYNQSQTVRVCSGGTFNFGGSTLTTTGNYTHIYTTAQGCDSTVQLDFAVLDSIRIASSSGVNGFCPTFGVRLGMNAPITNAQYQWYRNGNLLSGEVSDTLLASQVGDYRLDVVISPTCTLSSNSLSVSELNCNRVRGDLRYDNNPQTPMAGVPVHLKTLLGNILMSDTTDSLGMYEMVGYPNGNYLLDAGVNYQWGGVNSSDALLVSRYFTSLLTLTPLRIRAGDVNGNGTTNSVDALSITRRSANIITAFAAGDFVNSRPSVVAQGNPIDMNLRVLSTGDVNGSFGVPVSTPVLVLDTVYSTFPTAEATVRFTTSGSGIYERGVCWGTSPSPTIAHNKSIAGAGGFGFTHSFGGLTLGTQYYVRAYARNSSGTVYSNEMSFTHATWGRCPGDPSLTDIDGNVYNTVQIGTQCWTQSNLNVSKYRNGDNIPNIIDNTQWSQTNTSSTGAWCNYNNDANNGTTYGKLYNWYAVNDTRGLCPTGWHVSTDSEWNVMVKYLDPNADTAATGWQNTNAGTALKSTTGWNNNGNVTGNGTNSSGFTGLPGGVRYYSGHFDAVGGNGGWWSSSASGSGYAWHRYLTYSVANVYRNIYGDQRLGQSVRCVKNTTSSGSALIPTVTTDSATGITPSSATLVVDVTSDGGSAVTSRGVAYGLSTNPTTSGTITTDGSGVGSFVSTLTGLTASTTYYVRAYATNGVGTAYGNEVSFSTNTSNGFSSCGGVTDLDGNSYQTVQIGTQCWMQSNLKTSKYRNGDNIPIGVHSSGSYTVYNNNSNNNLIYGKLYNYYAVEDTRGICPTGWHVPTENEWQSLPDGGSLKSMLTQPSIGGWNFPNQGANNLSGFSALPGGAFSVQYGHNGLGLSGTWWSSTITQNSYPRYYTLNWDYPTLYQFNNWWQNYGASIRCIKD